MNEQQAINILKQFLDNALKIGVCQTIEQAQALAQAFKVVSEKIHKD
jgi:hypothetical protein